MTQSEVEFNLKIEQKRFGVYAIVSLNLRKGRMNNIRAGPAVTVSEV